MNTRSQSIRRTTPSLRATALAVALLAATLAPRAFAGNPSTTTAPTTAPMAAVTTQAAPTPHAKTQAAGSVIDESLLRFSRDGQTAMDSVRLARVDLFDGKTDLARQDLQTARKALIAARAEAPSFATTTQVRVGGKSLGTEQSKVKADVVPIDGDLVVTDEALMAPQHQGFLAKARTFMHLGDKASAVKALKEGEIDVTYQRKWLVIPDALRQLDQAEALTAKGQYYQANLALKALEDGVQVDTVSFGQSPATHPAS